MGTWQATKGAPRSVKGGRSTRYAERRAERRTQGAYAPRWSENTAAIFMRALKKRGEAKHGIYKAAKDVLVAGLDVKSMRLRGLTHGLEVEVRKSMGDGVVHGVDRRVRADDRALG